MPSSISITEIDLPTLFHDVTPIPQDDGPTPVCAIDYTPSFRESMNYLRAVLHADERSERSLQLTTICLKLNPANYTVWHFRRQCLAALSMKKKNQEEEREGGVEDESKAEKKNEEACDAYYDPQMIREDLQLASVLGGNNPKNYQIWYHRRALLEPTFMKRLEGGGSVAKEGPTQDNDNTVDVVEMARKELQYVSTVLDDDGKNYHAWSHRQWIVRTVNHYDLWQEEKDYAHKLILEDPRNNSSWNQRWFASHYGLHVPLSTNAAREEADYALQGAAIDPYNESPWRYLIGVVKEQMRRAKNVQSTGADDSLAIAVSALLNHCEEGVSKIRATLNQTDYEAEGCANLTSAHIDLLELKGDQNSLESAVELANTLATKHDRIRRKYWHLRETQLRSELTSGVK